MGGWVCVGDGEKTKSDFFFFRRPSRISAVRFDMD